MRLGLQPYPSLYKLSPPSLSGSVRRVDRACAAAGVSGVIARPRREVGEGHRGELATKVGYFGVKSANVHLVQMGT